MHEGDVLTTQALLRRIATILDVAPAAFSCREPSHPRGPTAAECEQALLLFRQIESPDRRGVVLKLLRALAAAP